MAGEASGGGGGPDAAAREEADARSVYVGNVDYGATPEELQLHFQARGAAAAARAWEGGRGRGGGALPCAPFSSLWLLLALLASPALSSLRSPPQLSPSLLPPSPALFQNPIPSFKTPTQQQT